MAEAFTEIEFREFIKAERRQAQAAANQFVAACESGDLESFFHAVDQMALAVGGWRLAMLGVARLHAVPDRIRDAFLSVWIESKLLPLSVGHRPTLARAMRILIASIKGHKTYAHLSRDYYARTPNSPLRVFVVDKRHHSAEVCQALAEFRAGRPCSRNLGAARSGLHHTERWRL